MNLDCADHIGRSPGGFAKATTAELASSAKTRQTFLQLFRLIICEYSGRHARRTSSQRAGRVAVNNYACFVMCSRLGFLFPLRCSLKHIRGSQGGIVVAKTLAKLTVVVASIAAATCFGTSSSRAYGDAPWCAVKTPRRRRVLELPIPDG